jgi:hypothetical protein
VPHTPVQLRQIKLVRRGKRCADQLGDGGNTRRHGAPGLLPSSGNRVTVCIVWSS